MGVRRQAWATVVAAALLVGAGGAAAGAPIDPNTDPAVVAARLRQQAADAAAQEAQQAQADGALSVTQAQHRLDAIQASLAKAQTVVESAAEDYAQAQADLATATATADKAKAEAAAASAAEKASRVALVGIYQAQNRSQGASSLSVLAGVTDENDLTHDDEAQRAVARKISDALAAQADARAAAQAATARSQAAQVVEHQADVKAHAELQVAQAAEAALEVRTAAATKEQATLVARLAALKKTTVQAEQKAEQARQDAAQALAAAQARAAAEARAEAAARAAAAAAAQRAAAARAASRGARGPVVVPVVPVSNGASSAAQGARAVAWAEARVGVMYQFGGTGDPGYDCSGLTEAAWESVGIEITRSSRSQYDAVSHIGYSQLRPGDLVFYATDPADPGTIYHVAMVAGGGMIVEAPLPGFPVHVTPMRWTADLMPFAGRP